MPRSEGAITGATGSGRPERPPGEAVRHGRAGPAEHGRNDVDESDGGPYDRGRHVRKPVHDERDVDQLLVHAEVVQEKAMLAEILPVIGRHRGHQVVGEPRGAELRSDRPELDVSRRDAAEVGPTEQRELSRLRRTAIHRQHGLHDRTRTPRRHERVRGTHAVGPVRVHHVGQRGRRADRRAVRASPLARFTHGFSETPTVS